MLSYQIYFKLIIRWFIYFFINSKKLNLSPKYIALLNLTLKLLIYFMITMDIIEYIIVKKYDKFIIFCAKLKDKIICSKIYL